MNTASTISQRDAYKLMLKDYPDVMSIEQMCEILSISTKTGYRILREGKVCCLKVGRAYRIPKAHLFTYLCIPGLNFDNHDNYDQLINEMIDKALLFVKVFKKRVK